MPKKYLSLEEAAEFLGISVEEMKKLRENYEVRGYADRATWKFRLEDLETYSREQSAQSDPEVPLLGAGDDDGGSRIDLSGDDESIHGDESDVLAEQPTIIRDDSVFDGDEDLLGPSDSDVRLVLDDDIAVESGPDSGINLGESDSDVRLFEDSGINLGDSDSDVRLVGDDTPAPEDSDSDVRLMSESDATLPDSDSDVRLVDDSDANTGSDEPVGIGTPDDSEVRLVGDSTINLDDDDGISIFDDEPDVDSEGMTMAAGSGILRSPADSGISLEADSGVNLSRDIDEEDDVQLISDDSGISLFGDDSDITLDTGDSGISLEAADSGISLEADDDRSDRTMPMMEALGDDLDETQMEIPLLADDDDFDVSGTDVEIPMLADDDDTDGVIVFDDDEEVSDASPTMLSSGDDFDDFGDDAFDLSDPGGGDEFAAADDFDDFAAEDELDISPDIMGEDDELDVFDAADDDFEDGFASGTSTGNFAEPVGQMGAVVATNPDWGVGTFLGVAACSGIMLLCGAVMFDLVRSMWAWEQPVGFNSALLEQVRSFF